MLSPIKKCARRLIIPSKLGKHSLRKQIIADIAYWVELAIPKRHREKIVMHAALKTSIKKVTRGQKFWQGHGDIW